MPAGARSVESVPLELDGVASPSEGVAGASPAAGALGVNCSGWPTSAGCAALAWARNAPAGSAARRKPAYPAERTNRRQWPAGRELGRQARAGNIDFHGRDLWWNVADRQIHRAADDGEEQQHDERK